MYLLLSKKDQLEVCFSLIWKSLMILENEHQDTYEKNIC
jgi:hypothetical protein